MQVTFILKSDISSIQNLISFTYFNTGLLQALCVLCHLHMEKYTCISKKSQTGCHINKYYIFKDLDQDQQQHNIIRSPHKKVIQVGHQLCFQHSASGTSLCASFLLLLLLLSTGPEAAEASLLHEISQHPPLLFPLLNHMCMHILLYRRSKCTHCSTCFCTFVLPNIYI